MKSRIRARGRSLHRFLRPGALARLRDSRIRPRSADLISLPAFLPNPRPLTPPPSPVASTVASPVQPEERTAMTAQDAEVDPSPFFVARSYGPRFPQRRRLFASKAVVLANPVAGATDLLVAHR